MRTHHVGNEGVRRPIEQVFALDVYVNDEVDKQANAQNHYQAGGSAKGRNVTDDR